MNNLDIDLDQFKKMKALDRDVIIYQNLVHFRGKMGEYKVNKKIQYVWLSLLTFWMGIKRIF